MELYYFTTFAEKTRGIERLKFKDIRATAALHAHMHSTPGMADLALHVRVGLP